MRGWRRPALAWLALAVYLLPASAFAQATKAGVVTTLEGNVTAVRAVAPQPVALKFKDDVFLQDRVVTGEQSFARLLLGGKAVVSIRERSAVTITEVPGRSTIDVESGKIALSVARDRMQPGEVINIKMPNAVAGVRGTVVIAEVSYAMVGGAQQAISNLAVLRGQVEAVHTNAAGAAIGTPVMVGAMQKFSATPTTASTGTVTLEQIGGIVQGLQAKGAADPGTASQAPARLEAVNTAVALLTALTGTGGSQTVQHLATGTPRDILTPADMRPPQTVTIVADAIPSPIVPTGSVEISELQSLLQPPPPPVNTTTVPSGQNLLTFTGSEVQSSDGTPIVPTTDPLLSRTGFTISQQGSDDLMVAKSDANVTLPGPLMKLTDTSVQAGDAFLSVAGQVSSTSPQPFIDLDPTTVMAPGNLVEVIGPAATLGLAGTLVKDTGGTVSVGGSVVAVSEGGTLTSTGSGALVQLNGTTMTASSLLSVVGSGSSAMFGGTLLFQTGGNVTTRGAAASITSATLESPAAAVFQIAGGSLSALGQSGDLLRANAGTVNLGGTLLDSQNTAVSLAGAVATLNNGSQLIQNSGPFVSVHGGKFNADALLRADGTGNTFAFKGTVLDLTDTTAGLGLIADFPDQGTDGVTLSLASGEPAARVTRSTLRIDRGPFVSLVNDVCSACPPILISGVALISTGTAATPSSITVGDELVALGNVAFLGADPIAQLTRTTVQQTGDGSAFISWFPDATFGAATTKPLLVATDSTLDVPGRAIFQFGGARLAATTGGAPFLSLINTTVNAGWLVDMLSGQLEVAGPLAAFSGGSSTIGGALLRILGGASVITSAATPTVSIAGGTHQFGWVFELDNGGVTADQVVTGFGASPDVTLRLGTTQPLRQDSGVLQAPLLSASNATIDAATGLRLDTVRLDTFSRLFDFTNSTVTGGSLGFIDLARSARLVASIPDAGLVNLFHSSMMLSGNALARVRGAPTTGGSLLQIGTPTAASSLVSLAGGSTLALLTNAPLLSVTDGSAAQIFGSLIAFVGTGNTVTVDNNLCLAFICATVNGVKIAHGASVLLSSIRIETDPISGLAGNTLTVGADDALILIDGADSRLLIAGTGADVPDVRLDDTFVALSAGQTLKTFSGVSTRSGTSPVVFIRDSLVDGPDATLVVADPTANATLQAGPLMKITDSTLEVARLLLVQGTLISLGASPLIALDPVTINAQTLIEVAAGGNLSLAGPLLTDLGGTISTKQDAIIVAGSLMSIGAAALVGLQGTTLNVGTAGSQASLFKMTGPVSLGGPLLSASGATVRTTGDTVGVFDGGQLAQTGGAALLLLSNSTLATGGAAPQRLLNVSGVGGTSGQTPSTAVIMGSLLDATNSVVTTTGNGVAVVGGALFSSLGAPLFMLNGSSLTTGPGAPVNELDGALLNMSGVAANGVPSTVTLQAAFVSAFGDSTITTRGNVMQIAGGTIFLGLGGGPLIQTVDSRLATNFDVLAAYNASIVLLGGPLLNVIGGSLDVGRRVVGVFDGSDVSAVAGDALVSLVNGNHVLGRDPGSAAFTVGDAGSRLTVPGGLLALNGATVTMFGPFLQITPPGVVNAAGPLLDMTGGALTSNTPNAFIGVSAPAGSPGALTVLQFTRLAAGANLTLHGSLVSSLDTSFTATDVNRGAFAVNDGASLTTTGTSAPLFSFVGTVFNGSSRVTSARQLITVSAAAGAPAPSMTLSGPLLSADRTMITTGDPATNPFGLVSFTDGATVTGSAQAPFLSFNEATADLSGSLITVRRSPSAQLPTTVTLADRLLRAVDSTVRTASLGFDTFFGTTGSTCCSSISVQQGARLVTTSGVPLVELLRSTFNAGPDPRSGSNFFFVSDTFNGAPAGELIAPATASLAGPVLVATDSTVSALFDLVGVRRSTLTTTTTSPLVQLTRGALTLGGLNTVTNTTANGRLFDVFGGVTATLNDGSVGPAPALADIAGPVLQAIGATINTTAEIIGVNDGGWLTSATALPLVTLSGTSLTAGYSGNNADILEVGGANGVRPAAATLHGPLLVVSGGSNVTLSGRLVNVFDSGQLTVTGTALPLVSFTGGTHVLGTNSTTLFNVSAVAPAAPSSISVSGPLFSASQAAITIANTTTSTAGMLFVGDSGALTSTTTAPLFSFDGGTYDAPNFMSVRRSTTAALPTTVTLAGPLFAATNGAAFTLGSRGNITTNCCTPFFVSQGAHLSSTAADALIQLSGVTFDNRDPVRSGSDIFAVTDTFGSAPAGETIAPARVDLAGSLLSSTNSTIETLFQLVNVSRSTLKSTGLGPLVDLNGGSVMVGGPNPFASPAGTTTFARIVSLVGAPGLIDIAGPLLRSVDTTINSTGEVLGILNGATLTSATTSAMISISGGSVTTGPTANTMTIAGALSSSVQLAGPLFSATNTTLRNGDQTTVNAARAFAFIGDSSRVTSTATDPMFILNGASASPSGSFLSVRRSLTTATPTTLTLSGPLARLTNDSLIDVSSLALGTACCAAFDVDQAAQLISATTAALIQLDASRINAGPDVHSGGTLFLVSDSGLADGPIVASPARVTLNGPLISSVNSKLSSLFSLVGVGRSTLTSTSLDPLIQLTGFKDDLALQLGGVDPFVALPNNQTRTGRVLNIVASATTATVGDAALVSLAGPLLSAVSAPIQLTGDVIGVFNGAKVDSTSTKPFLLLSGETTALVAGTTDPGSNTVLDGRLLLVSGIGGPDGVTPASLTLSGPLLRQEGGSIVDTNSRGLSLFTDGALVTRAPPTDTSYPLLQVDASSLSVGGTSRTGVLFEVTGSGALAADTQTNPVTGEASTLQFGQQRPLQHNGRGALLEASNSAFVNIRGANGTVLRLDTALLDATAPIFLLTTAARVQTSGNGIDLVRNARLQASNASDAVVRIDSQARMDVLNGSLASVSASRINVAGDLVRMGSNSLLNVTNGVLLSVLNGGIANINGALVAFTGANGLINITNTLAPTTFIAGIPVNVAPGGNIAIGQGALAGLNVNGNIIRINGTALPTGANANSGITGSLISVGANGTVRVGGTPN